MLSLQAHQEIIYKNSDFISHYEVINVGFHETAVNDVQVSFNYAIVTQFFYGSVRLGFEKKRPGWVGLDTGYSLPQMPTLGLDRTETGDLEAAYSKTWLDLLSLLCHGPRLHFVQKMRYVRKQRRGT